MPPTPKMKCIWMISVVFVSLCMTIFQDKIVNQQMAFTGRSDICKTVWKKYIMPCKLSDESWNI